MELELRCTKHFYKGDKSKPFWIVRDPCYPGFSWGKTLRIAIEKWHTKWAAELGEKQK